MAELLELQAGAELPLSSNLRLDSPGYGINYYSMSYAYCSTQVEVSSSEKWIPHGWRPAGSSPLSQRALVNFASR